MTEADREILAMARDEAGDCLERIEGHLLALENGSPLPAAIDAMFRDAHSMKGTAGMVGWEEVAAVAAAIEDRLSDCRERGEFPPELTTPLLRATDVLRRAVAGETSAVPAVLAELAEVSAPAAAPPHAAGANGASKPQIASPPHEPPRPAAGAGIRVGAEKVDRMLDAVGETLLHHRRLEHSLRERGSGDGDGGLAREELDMGERMLGELQDSVVDMRTLPLSSITAPFPRAVRDLGKVAGNEVELVITGAETQLDRVILEGIFDSILHLLRNAVAHGIESPDERERAGKPRTGRVELRAEPRGSMVAIEVADDGRGVSPELLVRGEEAGSLTEILSAAGFSTAPDVSALAGRGVGLDAVKSHVEQLGGSLDVRSEPSGGSKVTLLLPLTLALLRVLLCERAGQPFALPLASVREVVPVAQTTSLGGRRAVDLRGRAVPLADLAAILGVAAPPLPAEPPAMVLGLPGRLAAVACDRVLGDHEVVMKGLGPLLAPIPAYLGATILEDGRVALVLDPSHLLRAHSGTAAAEAVPASTRTRPTVLVVDDQFTVRELQRSILETSGYLVETARDGGEALDQIAHNAAIDMVLTDVQMPGMDGLELLTAIREQPDHSSLPVVIVTSMAGEADRERGLEEGADAYIVKAEFDQRTLLETVGRLVGS